MINKQNSILFFYLLYTCAPLAEMGDIIVTGKRETPASPEPFDITSKVLSTDADSALMLDRFPGITIGRKGGHGNEVIMRGLKNQGLNIIIEDKYLHGGCPNRMDPVTSYIAPEFYDIVEIETGVVSLAEGRGGPGGSIHFKEREPDFEKNPVSGLVGTGFENNSNTQHHFAQVAAGTKSFGIKGKYSYKDGKNYRDGHGDLILSSFNQQNSGTKFYWNPSDKTQFDLSFDYDVAKNVFYQGITMNSPYSKAQSFQLRGTHQFSYNSFIQSMKAVAYQTNVNHLMANDPNSSMYMRIQVDSITTGGKVQAKYETSRSKGLFGVDIQNLEQTPYRTISNGSYSPIRQPTFVNQSGIYGEHEWEVIDETLLKVGVRYDHVKAHAQNLDFKPSMMYNSARTEYSNVYDFNGDATASKTENNFSGLIRMNNKFNDQLQQAISLSRTVRTADPYERYIYRPHMTGSKRQLGNPNLAPEKHHQIDYSLLWNNAKTLRKSQIKFNIYYNRVTDFITKDRARGQNGIGVSDKRLIYRNIAAQLMGGTLSAQHGLNADFTLGGSMTYTYGKNTTDHRALYEIPPVILNFFTDYQYNDQLKMKLEVISQLNQNRIDSNMNTGAGIDAGSSKAWATLNFTLAGSPFNSIKNWSVRAGVRNLLNKAYARHINRADLITGRQVRVNDPGRSFWLATQYHF